MQDETPKTLRSREGLHLALYAAAFLVGVVVLTWLEIRSDASSGFRETTVAVLDVMESYVVVVAAAIYIAVEGGNMLSERYLQRRYREGRQEGETATLSAIEQAARSNGLTPEQIQALLDEAREIVRKGRAE